MASKYTLHNLNKCMKKTKATLKNYTKPLNCHSRIYFKCNCGKKSDKLYTVILNGPYGALCSACVKPIAGQLKKKIQQERCSKQGNFIYNSDNLAKIMKESEATAEIKNTNLSIRTAIKFKCKCGKKQTKTYYNIRKTGAYCKICVKSPEILKLNNKKRKRKLKEYQKNNPNARQCSRCGKYQNKLNFSKKRNVRLKVCKKCTDKNQDYMNKLSDYAHELKLDKGSCVDCGENNPLLLQFDHIHETTKKCGVTACKSKKLMKEEADKCEMRCIICHTRKSKKQMKWKCRSGMQKYINTIKIKKGGCELCGWFDKNLLEALHFDHLVRKEKLHNVSHMAKRNMSKKEIDKEIKKCRLICAHCHVLHTRRQRGFIGHNENLSRDELRLIRDMQNIIRNYIERISKTLKKFKKIFNKLK